MTAAISPTQALEHDRLVHALARRAVRPGVELDDLVQAGRLGLIAAAEAWREDGGASFPTFAFKFVSGRIAKARSRERGLGLGHGIAAPFVDSIDDADAAGKVSYSVDDLAAEAEQARRLRAAIATLEPEERRIIEGRLAGKPLESIGVEVGRDKSTVQYIEKRAVGKLRRALMRFYSRRHYSDPASRLASDP